jgi:MFS family permease
LTSLAVYRELLSTNVQFRRLFLARLVSLFGDWFHLMAVLALLRQMGVHSASSFGWVLILKSFPGALVAPVAGMVADRFSRRKMMLASDLVRAVLVLLMLTQIWFPSVLVLYLLIGLVSASAAFFEPARSALLPDLVSEDELSAANAMGAAVWSAMLTIGSAMGGLWTAWLGWEAALIVDAMTFLLSFWFLWHLQEPAWERAPGSGHEDWLEWAGIRQIMAGFRYMSERPRVWTLALVKTCWMLIFPGPLLLSILGERVYASSTSAILAVTVLYVARGIGTGTGPFVSRELSNNEPESMERFIFYGMLCTIGFYAIVPLFGSLWWAAACVILAHIGGATIWVFSTIRLQQSVPTQWRGRVFAAELMGFTMAMVVSNWMFGTLVDRQIVAPVSLVWVTSCGLSVVALLWLLRGRWLGWAKE